MKNRDYTYAVSRIRIKETKLFDHKFFEQLISQSDYDSVLRSLSEAGFGNDASSDDAEILSNEHDKLWTLMNELTSDMSVFDVFRVQNDYHNLKVSVKAIYSNVEPLDMFVSGGTVEATEIYSAVKNREFSLLAPKLAEIAEYSLDTLIKTGDSQLCDIYIDKACLKEICNIAENTNEKVIKDYAKILVDSSNIKIAVRGSRLNKSYDFFMKALVKSYGLNSELLAKSGASGFEAVCDYLKTTEYKDAVVYITKSLSAFEKWCDDLLINGMKLQKSEPFSLGPLVAYIIAKQNEINAVRLILIAKKNGLDDSIIRERIRETYV